MPNHLVTIPKMGNSYSAHSLYTSSSYYEAARPTSRKRIDNNSYMGCQDLVRVSKGFESSGQAYKGLISFFKFFSFF